MIKGYEKLTREERVERFKFFLSHGGNLILDGDYLMRVWSLANNYCGLEDMRLSEIQKIMDEAHKNEVLEIAKWSLQFPEEEREERITNEVIERLEGDYDYKVDVEISNMVYTLSHNS